MKKIFSYFSSLIELLYPRLCAACSEHLSGQETTLCSLCEIRLPFTNFHRLEQNPLNKKFWGRMEVVSIYSLLFFEKGSRAQELMHQLKYNKREDVGKRLAEILLLQYAQFEVAVKFKAIVYIPLHPKKQKKRGYNQCHVFAKTLSEGWKIPLYHDAISRKEDNLTQTGKNRVDRWENVSSIFEVEKPQVLQNKHILLIDDIITTGATLEACGQKILEVENTQLSILTLACTL